MNFFIPTFSITLIPFFCQSYQNIGDYPKIVLDICSLLLNVFKDIQMEQFKKEKVCITSDNKILR